MLKVRAIVGPARNSTSMERARDACRGRAWNHGVRTDHDIRRAVGEHDGVFQSRGAYLAVQGMEMVEKYWFLRDVGMHFDGWDVGPASPGISFVDQRRYFLLGIRRHHGEVEVGRITMGFSPKGMGAGLGTWELRWVAGWRRRVRRSSDGAGTLGRRLTFGLRSVAIPS